KSWKRPANMRGRGPRIVGTVVLLLTLAAGAVVVVNERGQVARRSAGEPFQRLVGGLGFWPGLGLCRRPRVFVPPVGFVCPLRVGPASGRPPFFPPSRVLLFLLPASSEGRRECGKPLKSSRPG